MKCGMKCEVASKMNFKLNLATPCPNGHEVAYKGGVLEAQKFKFLQNSTNLPGGLVMQILFFRIKDFFVQFVVFEMYSLIVILFFPKFFRSFFFKNDVDLRRCTML